MIDETAVQEISEASLRSLTEAEMAEWIKDNGGLVSYRNGRWWVRTWHGLYQPIHWLARLNATEAIRPTLACWGYRMTLNAAAASKANGHLSVHLLNKTELDDYTLENLPAKRRTDLRKCRKQVRIVRVIDPKVLLSQAYEVTVSAVTRLGIAPPPDREEFLESLTSYVRDPRGVFLAGFVGDNFAGYLHGRAVDGAAYIDVIRINPEYLKTAIGTGLTFDFVQVCRNSDNIHSIVYGQYVPDHENLNRFKAGMRFSKVNFPTRVWIAPFLKYFLRWRYPEKYRRLIGDLTQSDPE